VKSILPDSNDLNKSNGKLNGDFITSQTKFDKRDKTYDEYADK